MIEKVITLISIVLLFVGIISVFLARDLVRKRKNNENENEAVKVTKLVGFVVIILSLVTIYFL
ncbi:MAG: hypothetical protein PHR25_04800 [Clostridia bacterium]|nr:hypothetical protein [Clostridia bacterium]MDD4376083.1 hypothetical protein [Clostridia bacterium]